MSGARRAHDDVVVNGMAMLKGRLRGGPCRPFTADLAIAMPAGNIRRPDVLVDCGPFDADDLTAKTPVLVIEVLSRSTRQMDMLRKTAEYKTVPSMRYILLIDPDDVVAIFHSRLSDGHWTEVPLIGGETEVPMPDLNITLLLADFYEGTTI